MHGSTPLLLVILVGCAGSTTTPGDDEAPTEVRQVSNRAPIAEVEVESLPRVCPVDMIEVSGDYCTSVESKCLRWTVNPVGNRVCAEFRYPTSCVGKLVRKRFCIDEYEYPNKKGERPQAWLTWYDAKRALEARGKRMCTSSEWTMACEGDKLQPYPYGSGYLRDAGACNFDNPMPEHLSVFSAKRPSDRASQVLQALLVPAGSMPRCVSPYGVHDMVGNIDEWVINENGRENRPPYVSGLKSGHVFGVRNNCWGLTDVHGPTFSWYETGTRGCLSL
jgi:sulfatase modifying factor 1